MIYSITEGQQTEEYKKKKAAEEAEKNKENPRYSKFPNKIYGIDLKHYSTSINADIAKATDIAQSAINKKYLKARNMIAESNFSMICILHLIQLYVVIFDVIQINIKNLVVFSLI